MTFGFIAQCFIFGKAFTICIKGDGKLKENVTVLHPFHLHVNNLLEFEAEQNHVPRNLEDTKVDSENNDFKKYILLMASGMSLIGTTKKKKNNAFLLSAIQGEVYLSHSNRV